MKPEDVLTHPALVLTEVQRTAYFADGFLVLPDYVPQTWLARLRAATQEMLERSRTVAHSDGVFVLEEGHGPDTPRLHRVTSPQDQHPTFWDFMCDPVMTDLAADVVGPDVKFHHAKLNVKSERGTRGFKWHQDIPAWPHTDYSPVTIGVYIDGCDDDMGPLSSVRGSQLGPLHSQYDNSGAFVVRVRDEVVRAIPPESIVTATGGPGTTVLLNCRTIHGSLENRSDRARPLLLPVYSSADSFAYTPSPIVSPHMGDIVRGRPAKYACFDPGTVQHRDDDDLSRSADSDRVGAVKVTRRPGTPPPRTRSAVSPPPRQTSIPIPVPSPIDYGSRITSIPRVIAHPQRGTVNLLKKR